MDTDAHRSGPLSGRPLLQVISVPIGALKPDPANPRRHSPKQVRQLAASIEAFGFNVPILIDARNQVIAGHGRLAACKRSGWAEVPCIRTDHLSEAQQRAYVIADNRLSEVATWDDRLLAQELAQLAKVELNFDIETIGFEMGEIDLRIESIAARPEEAPETEPALPGIEGVAVTQLGDMWRLGRHKLLCGDARDETSHSLLLGEHRAAAVFTDPPYNVRIDGHVSGLGRQHHREFVMATGELSKAQFVSFLMTSLERMRASSAPAAIGFVFMDWRHMMEMLEAAAALQVELLNLCVWSKPNAGMGSLYRSQHELCFVFRLSAGHHQNNVRLGSHGRNRSNIWPYALGPGFGRAGEEGHLAALHPTVKPVPLIADAILDVTRRGDIILDPFLGSGSTLIAAERVGRRCFGLELDPLYCDVIVRRWQAHSGGEATLLSTGEKFDDIARRSTAGTSHLSVAHER
jgi:DNA modification methylase